MLLGYAREGKTVVRLKGGDPYLFGRGAEELEAIAAENIPFEVVPGVTSAIAVPAFAGIPVSHRDYSSSVHIITAHRKNGAAPDFDYQSLVKFNGTLIFLMGLGAIDAVTSGLLAGGMPGGMPCALIENGTRPNQRKVVSTVADISARRVTITSGELCRQPHIRVAAAQFHAPHGHKAPVFLQAQRPFKDAQRFVESGQSPFRDVRVRQRQFARPRFFDHVRPHKPRKPKI